MTTFPALEAALDQAAHRHYRRRSPFRPIAPALALACALALIVLVLAPLRPERGGEGAQDPAVIVPERTLALAHALAAAPREPQTFVGHTELAGVAADLALSVPYPPAARDTFDWAGTPSDPQHMAVISARSDVQWIVEYRAACLWVGFWDYAWRTGNEAALVAATTVLADLTQWPSFRTQPSRYWPELAAAAAARDPGPVQRELEVNCASVPMPWR